MNIRALLALMFASACAFAQTTVPVIGLQPPSTVYASLPTASTHSGVVYIVTDGNTGCTAGGGSTVCWFRSNGTTWISAGGGAAGATSSNSLTDLTFTRNATTSILNFTAGRCGGPNKTFAAVSAGTATITEATQGTGYAYCLNQTFYIGRSGTLKLSLSNATDGGIITDFPAGSIPVAEWATSSGGVWAATGTDHRTFLAAPAPCVSSTHMTAAEDLTTGGCTYTPASTLTLDSELDGHNYAPDSGSSDAYVASFANRSCPLAYKDGLQVQLKVGTVNTGLASLNLCGLGVVSIKNSDGTTDPADGDFADEQIVNLAYQGTVFRRTQTAAVSSSSGCTSSISSFCVSDEFLPIPGNTASVGVGQLLWTINLDTGGGGSLAYIDGTAGHDGIGRLTTAATSGDGVSLRQGPTILAYSRLDNTSWTAEFLVRPNNVATSTTRVGFTSGSTAITVYQTAGATWKAEACTASCVSGGADTGVTPADGTWYYIRMVSNGSGVNVFINGGSATAMTGTFPTVSMRGFVSVASTGAGAKTLDVDYFSMSRTTGTRY